MIELPQWVTDERFEYVGAFENYGITKTDKLLVLKRCEMGMLVEQLLKTSEIKNMEKKQMDILTKFIPGGFMIQRASWKLQFQVNFRDKCDSHGSHLPLCGAICFPTAPLSCFDLFPMIECRH